MLLDLAHRVGSAAATSAWLGCANLQAIGRQQPRLSESAISDLRHQGFAIVQNWLPADEVAALLEDALALESIASEARIGSSETRRSDRSIRYSKSVSLHPPPALAAGRISTRLALSRCMSALCEEVNGGLSILPTLVEPSSTELGYIYYPTGGFYERHLDVASSADSAAPAAAHAATARAISVLLYLDAGWAAEWGGELRIWPKSPAPGEDDAASTAQHVDVVPEGGTLVLLRSDRIVHEVLPTRRPRHAVVGWLRSPRTHPSRSSPLRSVPLRPSASIRMALEADDSNDDPSKVQKASAAKKEAAAQAKSEAAAKKAAAEAKAAAAVRKAAKAEAKASADAAKKAAAAQAKAEKEAASKAAADAKAKAAGEAAEAKAKAAEAKASAAEAAAAQASGAAATQLLSPRCASNMAARRVHREAGFAPPPLVAALRRSLRSLAFQPTASYSSNGAQDDLRRALTSRPSVEDPAFDELYERLLFVREELEGVLGRELSSGIEATFVVYQPGDYYRKHIDSIQGVDAGGSGRRAVSFIVYLPSSDAWRESDGGALRIFPAVCREDGEAAAQHPHGHPTEDVLPEAGLLVLFDSKRVWHEVRPTMRERACLVGWFREAAP